MLDGKPANFSLDDLARRNTITTLLSDWGLLDIVDESACEEKTSMRAIKIISHRDKKEWTLESKYDIGNAKSHK